MLSFLVLLLKFASFTSANTECGIKGSTHPLWRIVGGNDTKPLEYPWMAFYGCGGSIINDQWIITAGHCAGPQFKSEILFGAYDINKYGKNFSLESTAIMIESLHAYRHPKYELDENVPGGGRPKYDMSLIKLKHKLDLNGKDKHLRPICLPTNTTTVKDLMSTECVVTGWGNTESSGHEHVFPLQVTSAPIVDSDTCIKKYPNDFDPKYAICAGFKEGGHGPCNGDSGGALQCKLSDNKWYIVGTVSWGISCSKPGYPDVYASVIPLLDWIQTTIKNN